MTDESNPFRRQDFKGEVIADYSELTEAEADILTLGELRARGSDLSRPRHIVHHLWFGAAGDREFAGAVIQSRGYDVILAPMENTEASLLLRAERNGIADEIKLREDRLVLSDIARAHQGWYDGWAAAED